MAENQECFVNNSYFKLQPKQLKRILLNPAIPQKIK